MTSDRPDPKTPRDGSTDPLEAFFAAGRARAPELDAALRVRIIAAAASRPAPAKSRGLALRRWLSGWTLPGLASGVSAAMLGLWVGLAAPLPVVALDMPVWMVDALSYVDVITMPLIGPDDPIFLGF